MNRRRKTSTLETMLDWVTMLPWWAGVTIAMVGHVVLHRMASPLNVTAVQPGQMGQWATQAIWVGLANVGQYIVPLVGLVGAGVSFVRRHQRSTLLTDVARAHSASALNDMSWLEFEMLVGEAFALQGYRVAETGGGGADGGIDLVLTKGREKFLVQCKQWKAFRVGVGVVRELYGVMTATGASGGFVVTSGRYSKDAKAFAEGRNVTLIDGPVLFALIQRAQRARAQPPSLDTRPSPLPSDNTTPHCPLCRASMVKRTARRGNHVGTAFWGCSEYPTCKGTRPLA